MPAQTEAVAEAARLRDRLLALRAAQGLATWLAARPQLGHDLFARGAPEWLGTDLATAYQVDVVSFLLASMALFDDGARDVDIGAVYRPPWHDLHRPRQARQRILAMLASLPDGAALEQFLPAAETDNPALRECLCGGARPGASTLLAGLELAREGDVALIQEEAFLPIHLWQADAEATASLDPSPSTCAPLADAAGGWHEMADADGPPHCIIQDVTTLT